MTASRRIPAGAVAFDAPAAPTPTVPHDAVLLGRGRLDEQGVPVSQPSVARRLETDAELARHVEGLLARTAAEAHARGVSEGRTAARAEDEQLARAILLAFDEHRDRLDAERAAAIGGVVDLAAAMAEAVLGRTPHDEGQALLRRLAEALDLLDERPLTVWTSGTDEAAVRAAVGDTPGLEVRTDGSLQPGEARVQGAWSDADLTQAAAWDAVRRTLNG